MKTESAYFLENPASLNKLHFSDIANKNFIVPDNLPVSKKSKFGDETWLLKDLNNNRHATINNSKLTVEWNGFQLPELIIEDLKRFALICLYTPLGSTRGKNKSLKPNTVVDRINCTGKFLSRLCSHPVLESSCNVNVSVIHKLSDISYYMLKEAALNFSGHEKNITNVLKKLSDPRIQSFLLSGREGVQWTELDIDNLPFNFVEKQEKDEWEDKTIPNKLFRFITREAVTDVVTALKVLNIAPCDKSANNLVDGEVSKKFFNASGMLEDYSAIRRLNNERNRSSGTYGKVHANGSKYNSWTKPERDNFRKKYGITVKQFMEWWMICRKSAQILILQYIGFRHSESLSLKFDHAHEKGKYLLEKSGSIWMINGAVAKNKDNSLPINHDQWVAIPIVRDAIRLLEAFNVVLNKDYVFSSSQERGNSDNKGESFNRNGSEYKPYSPTGFNQAINEWLKRKDTEGIWSHWRLNVKQFRHSIANQLARAELGLEFITYQMKHVVQALSTMPSDVTLGYGGIPDVLQGEALRSAKEEAIRNLYDPKMPISGGMADEFKSAREGHFNGAIASGYSEKQYFDLLVDQGVPFINIGGGYCSGRKYVKYSDGTKNEPACIGNLECNPKRCKNALITKSHIPVWKDIYESNINNSRDPHLFYAKDDFLEKANDAREILVEMGEDVGALDE